MFLQIAVALAFSKPLVIAHRGASAYRPEHTLAAYELAVDLGADFIEPDLVMTKDGVLIARHENELSTTTNVADKREFASRKVTKSIDGRSVTGWFSEDFTIREIKKLRAKEPRPQLRRESQKLDGLYEIPTFEEILVLLQRLQVKTGRKVGIYPELKHPSFFRGISLPMESAVIQALVKAKLPPDQVFIQCFEVQPLKSLRQMGSYPLIQLIGEDGGPYDVPGLTPREMVAPSGLDEIKTYADGIGVSKGLLIPRRADGTLGVPTTVVSSAQSRGLKVHVWTFRNEAIFLPAGLKPAEELMYFINLGIDGFFTDFPDWGVAAKKAYIAAGGIPDLTASGTQH